MIKAFDHLGHALIIQSFKSIRGGMIVGIAVEGSVGDHHRRKALPPEGGVIRKIHAGDQAEACNGLHRKGRMLLECDSDFTEETPVSKVPDNANKVSCV